LGCDGSGKSTHAKTIAQWLSWKVDVVPIYLGSGDGHNSLLRWPLKLASNLLRKTVAGSASRIGTTRLRDPGLKQYQHLMTVSRAIWALALAYEKRIKLRKATRARNRGMIVICDRFPQDQVMGFNDGPLLSHWLNHRSGLLRALARWERIPYRSARLYPPDLVIKLHVTHSSASPCVHGRAIGEWKPSRA
jgi:hypothetical protein